MRPTLSRLTHPRRPAAPPRRPHVARPQPPAAGPGPERRAREAGGPQDNASYDCECGFLFQASVSTSVSCPRCGQGQAW
jgi:hypothetical protein